MYLANAISQEKPQTNLQTLRNINYESQYFTSCIPFRGDLISYASTKTPSDREVILFFAESRNRDRAVSNIEIARKKGISITTVKRSTRKLATEGFLEKYRLHEYDMNTYKFTDQAKESFKEFLYWFGNLTLPQRHLFMTHGIIDNSTLCKVAKLDNDPLNKSLSINLNLFKNGTEAVPKEGYARMEQTPLKKLQAEQRQSIDARRLRYIENIGKKWGLAEDETWRLQAYPIEVLREVDRIVQSILKRGRCEAFAIEDRLKYLFGIMNKEWIKQGSKPNDFDFDGYCHANKLDPLSYYPPRPLTLPPNSANPPQRRSYASSDNSSTPAKPVVAWKPDVDDLLEQTKEEKIAKAKRDAENLEAELKNPIKICKNTSSFASFMLQQSEIWLAAYKKDAVETNCADS
jgi:DNA-binding MarR family transcriptional regulator